MTIENENKKDAIDILKICENEQRSNNDILSLRCKHFHQDTDMTPNNYDLYLDYNRIPINIKLESKYDLLKQLKRHLPLSKRLHLQLEEENVSEVNTYNICTKTRVIFKNSDDEIIMRDVK